MKFTTAQKIEINKQFRKLTIRELYDHLSANFHLNTGFTSFRHSLYDLGLKKCKILRWTEAETQFLLNNYKTLGNIEIAEKLSKKDRVFTSKNIIKKMLLMNLKRTPEELASIIEKHKKKGSYSEANYRKWKETKCKEGERRIWNLNQAPKVMIKINGKFTGYSVYRYKQLHGAIPSGFKVYHKDCNPLNVEDDNLVIRKRTLNKAERTLYKRNIQNYKLSQKETPIHKAPKPEIPQEPKTNLISVKIGKMTVKVKPGTNIETLRKRYENHYQFS